MLDWPLPTALQAFAAVIGRFALAIVKNLVFTLVSRHRALAAQLFGKGITMSSQHIQASLPGMHSSSGQVGSLRAVMLDRLTRAGRAVWKALEAYGERRSDRELMALSEHFRHTNPTLARELRSYVRGGSSY
jgi:hypothetical protein